MKYAIVYVICIICLIGVGVLMWRVASTQSYKFWNYYICYRLLSIRAHVESAKHENKL